MRLAKIAGVVLLSTVLLSSIACATPTYHLSTSVNGQGSVMPSSGDYLEDESVILLANPASGWEFDHWEGAASGDNGLVTITMNSDKSVTAFFVETGNVTTSEFTTYTDDTGSFSISVPDSWEMMSMGESGAIFSSTLQCSGGYASVTVLPMETNGLDLQSTCEVLKTGLEGDQGYTFISEDEITIGGIPAMKLTFTAVSLGVTLQMMQGILIEGQTTWMISCGCSPECWDTYQGTFNTMISSFQVLD